MEKEILLIGESHPSSLEYFKDNYEFVEKYFQGAMKEEFQKEIKYNPRRVLLYLGKKMLPKTTQRYWDKKINKHKDFFIQIFRTIYDNPEEAQEIRNKECDLIRDYKPDVIFLEVQKSRKDIKDISKEMEADFISFDYDGDKKNYESELIERLIGSTSSGNKIACVIGQNHVEPARETLIKKGINPVCIDLSLSEKLMDKNLPVLFETLF